MIYLTGDVHGGVTIQHISEKNLKPKGIKLTKDDYLIILGDFGFPFLDSEINNKHGEYAFWMKWLSEKPYTVLWVDGNHENFNFWDKQPVTQWHGGNVQIHPDASNVIRLMRGEIYDIDGNKFFTMGGADSIDKMYRTLNYSWWVQELPSEEEYANAITNLEKHNYTVDYVLTHCCSSRTQYKIDRSFARDCMTDWFNDIEPQLQFKHWYFGHYHIDETIDDKHTCLYNEVIELGNTISSDKD